MSDINPSEFRTKLDVIPREVAATAALQNAPVRIVPKR